MSNRKTMVDITVAVNITAFRRDFQPLFSDAQGCWCVVDLWFYRFNYDSGTLRKVFRLPPKSGHFVGRFKDALARSWLRRKLNPGTSINNMVVLPNGNLLVIFDRVYLYSPALHGKFAEVLSSGFLVPMAAPLRGGVAVHPFSQRVYYGEYLNGHERDIRVCCVDVEAKKIEACWSFSRGEIKHIHAIHYDRFRNRLWICTGDRDHESAFYFTDDEFRTVHRFAGGDQSWRAIALLFDERGMEWGMDAGKDAPANAINHIYRYDFATGSRTNKATIGNPAYAACEFTDGTALMQTTFEPGRQQDTPAASGLWFRNSNHDWRQCLSLPYQFNPREASGQYGSILLPTGLAPKAQILLTPVNCAVGSNMMHRMSIMESHD